MKSVYLVTYHQDYYFDDNERMFNTEDEAQSFIDDCLESTVIQVKNCKKIRVKDNFSCSNFNFWAESEEV